jgi:PAS domain S-box-containing protein
VDQIASKILRAGLLDAHSQQQETVQFLGIVRRLAALLPQDLERHQICQEFARIIIEETNFENCSILLWDAQNGCLSLAASDGLQELLDGEALPLGNEGLRFTSNEGLAGQAFITKLPLFIEDSTQQEIPYETGTVGRPGSWVCVPVLDAGVLNLSGSSPAQFTMQMRRYWELLGAVLGYCLLRPSLHSENRKNAHDGPKTSSDPEGFRGDHDREVDECVLLAEDALQYIPQGICLLDVEGRVTRVNRSIESSYGRNASELIGRSPAVIFHDPMMFQTMLEKACFSSCDELVDAPLVNADGEVYPADLNMVRMTGRSGTVKGYLLVINDVTKKKAFAEKMLQAEKLAALGTMAGGVAHDFNNLLMVILGNLQLLLPRAQDGEARHRLETIEKAVYDGAHTVERLQKFTEGDRHHQFAAVATDVNAAIEDVIAMTRPRWKNSMEKHGHTIHVKTDLDPECFCRIHMSDCREILTNLILNAIEAMPQGGVIALKTRLCDDMVKIEVRDTGIGMTQEVAARIFDPFYTSKGVGNSGLGLSVSWSLITRSGGEIRIKSKPAKGTLFTIKLPRADLPQVISPVRAQVKTSTAHHRLLVVDDDESVLQIIQDMLSFKGHEVIALADGQEALDILEKEDFDLVVTDLGMPGISGWEVAKRVKAKNPKLPVVLLTGWGTQFDGEDLSEEGVDIVLTKPLSCEELSEGIDRLL